MKAWIVHDHPNNEFAAIVFAQTRGQAIAYCVHNGDVIGQVEFVDVRIRRAKEADKYFHGKRQMEWYDDNDRIVMVRDYGFSCESVDGRQCENCGAKEFCDTYNDWLEQEAEQ